MEDITKTLMNLECKMSEKDKIIIDTINKLYDLLKLLIKAFTICIVAIVIGAIMIAFFYFKQGYPDVAPTVTQTQTNNVEGVK